MKVKNLIAAIMLMGAFACEKTATDHGKMICSKVCKENECERERRMCRADLDADCDRCYDLCGDLIYYDWDTSCFITCDDVCDSSRCFRGSCDGSPCLEYGYVFLYSGTRDETLYEVCSATVQDYASCGYAFGIDCDYAARLGLDELVDVLQCAGSLGCVEDMTSCGRELVSGTLGEEGCAQLRQACGWDTCDPMLRDFLRRFEAVLGTGLTDALRWCFGEPGCDDITACVEAWTDALMK